MKLKLFFLLLAVASFSYSKGQMKKWTWDTYNMKFKIYESMEVTINNEKQFEAKDNNFAFDIYPRKGEDLSYAKMKDAVRTWANDNNVDWATYNSSGNEQPIYISDLHRYWGCAIDGTNKGFPVTLLLLVNPDYPSISFYVWISYRTEYYDDALKILKSFEPM